MGYGPGTVTLWVEIVASKTKQHTNDNQIFRLMI